MKAIELETKAQDFALTTPCQYSVEELKERCLQAIEEAEQGLGTPIGELSLKYPV